MTIPVLKGDRSFVNTGVIAIRPPAFNPKTEAAPVKTPALSICKRRGLVFSNGRFRIAGGMRMTTNRVS
jgi:hypothetical protein